MLNGSLIRRAISDWAWMGMRTQPRPMILRKTLLGLRRNAEFIIESAKRGNPFCGKDTSHKRDDDSAKSHPAPASLGSRYLWNSYNFSSLPFSNSYAIGDSYRPVTVRRRLRTPDPSPVCDAVRATYKQQDFLLGAFS
jgi:hypothetical protein